MCKTQVTRRDAMKAGMAAAISMTAAATVSARDKPAAKAVPTIGVSTLGFGDLTNAELAEELAGQGIKVVQLFLSQKDSRYWVYNGRADVSDMTTERCRAIAETYRSRGIEIHSIGVYTNLVHPDDAERAANLDYFEEMMRIAKAMGVKMLITEAGHFHSDKPAPRVPYDFREDVWHRTVATMKSLAERAEKYDVTVLCEPMHRSFFSSAKRTRVFLEEVGSRRIRALLDPANLLEHNDLDEMFNQLQPWIDCLHAKDRKLHVDRGVAAGKGDLDYRQFVRLAAERTPTAPLILEYVGPKDYKQALAVVRDAMRLEGLPI
jgi:sugar phosphate isomerase/epimerase